MAKSRAEIQKQYRERKKQKEGEQFLKAERLRKRQYYVPVTQLSKADAVKRRRATLERVKKCLIKKKKQSVTSAKDELLPTTRSTSEKLLVSLPFLKHSGKAAGCRKRGKAALRKAYREIEKLRAENKSLQRQKKYAKRYQRARSNETQKLVIDRTENETVYGEMPSCSTDYHPPATSSQSDVNHSSGMKQATSSGTPRTVTRLQLKQCGLPRTGNKLVRRRLLFANALIEEIKEGLQQRKKNKLRIITGKILRKYNCASMFGRAIGISRKTVTRSAEKNKKPKTAKRYRHKETVIEFLEREDNCTILPGKRDVKKVGKEHRQKRILNDYLHNLYDKFRLERPDVVISKATFCRIRPTYILPVNFCSRTTCLCVRHQNLALKLRALRNQGTSVSGNPDIFIKNASDEQEVVLVFDQIEKNDIAFSQWQKVQENGKMRHKQVVTTMKKKEFIDMFLAEVKEFREHVYRVKNQYAEMRKIRENLQPDEVLVWMDFAENFSCSVMEEIQSAYWNSNMVTLHTHVAYFPKGHERNHMSIVGVSEVLLHNASLVHAMICKLVPLLKEEYPEMRKLHYLTDSPTSQYRNKTIFQVLCLHKKKFGVQATWNYLEAGHGKGPCDGLGASVKRSADMNIKQGKVVIQSGIDFFNWASNTSGSAVSYFYISEDEYAVSERTLHDMADNLQAIKGTMKLHAVVPVSENAVMTREVSCSCLQCREGVQNTTCEGWTEHCISKKTNTDILDETAQVMELVAAEETSTSAAKAPPDSTDDSSGIGPFTIGEYVAALYEACWFIGEIVEVDDDEKEVLINFMERGSKVDGVFRWPRRRDEIWIRFADVIQHVPVPEPCGKSKRTFKLSKDVVAAVESSFPN